MTLRVISSHSEAAEDDPPKPPRVEQFKGCILGCALGDAVGAVIERKPTAAAQAYITKCVQKFDFSKVRAHHGGSAFGQYTDDTQLTRELALSIVDEGTFVPEDFAARVCRMFDENLIVGGGRATAAAAKLLKEGTSWRDSGSPPPAAGNGAAMRAAPIGLLYWNDGKGLLQAASDQAIITHKADMSVAGSMAIAMATAMCLNASVTTSSPKEPGWWSWLSRFIWAHYPEFGSDIAKLSKIVFDGRKKARRIPGSPGSTPRCSTGSWRTTTRTGRGSVPGRAPPSCGASTA
jgi:ADP-ribosylglycohydrolase